MGFMFTITIQRLYIFLFDDKNNAYMSFFLSTLKNQLIRMHIHNTLKLLNLSAISVIPGIAKKNNYDTNLNLPYIKGNIFMGDIQYSPIRIAAGFISSLKWKELVVVI